MKHFQFAFFFLLAFALGAQAASPQQEPVGDVRLITPIFESPPMTPSEANAFAHFQTFRNWGIMRLGLDSVMMNFTGADVTICICDTGLSDHRSNESTVADSKNFSPDPTVKDGNGHGGHVHGIISEIAPDARVLVAKVLGDAGLGSNIGVAAGVRWCRDMGADVINMSLGSSSSDAGLKSAIEEVIAEGVVVVAAAGNSGQSETENRMGYPARHEETIAVGSFDYDMNLSYFSSSGEEGDIIAPGEQILSTWKGQQYVVLSGTSMAAPFVTGMIALKIEQVRSSANIERMLEMTSVDVSPEGFDNATFAGRVSTKFFSEQTPVIDEPVDAQPDEQPPLNTKIALMIIGFIAVFMSISQLLNKKEQVNEKVEQ